MSPLILALLVPVVLTLIGAVVWLLVDRRRNRSVKRFEERRDARREITGTGFFGEHSEDDSSLAPAFDCHDSTPPGQPVSWCSVCGAFSAFGEPWQLPELAQRSRGWKR